MLQRGLDLPQLLLVQAPRVLLAVARDKRDGVAGVQQLNDRRDLRRALASDRISSIEVLSTQSRRSEA